MPLNIPDDLPAKQVLEQEKIFVMSEYQAAHQDIRPLEVVLLNLMPKKIETETQLARLLSNTPLQVNLTLLTTETYKPKNISEGHLGKFYSTFSQIREKKFDGLIVTGAPVELLEWEDVKYWDELCEIFQWTRSNVWSSFFVCWGAQAALKYFYDVEKYKLERKMFGVFWHRTLNQDSALLRGFDEEFLVPVSRHTEIRREDIEKHEDLEILSDSEKSGLFIIQSKDMRQLYVFNHAEYDAETLQEEYCRDISKKLSIQIPQNYFPHDDPKKQPLLRWRAHANLLFSNWLNYYVYQSTPYNLNEL